MRSRELLLAATIACIASPALADILVVRANGPSAARYAAGRSLPDASRIVLQKGDQVVLLDAHGTRTLSGPGTFPATSTAAATASASTLLALAGNATQRRARVGAVRQLPTGATARPNIFFVDGAAPGPMCVADPAALQLWRAKADAPAQWTITDASGTRVPVTWIKGQSTQPWPAATRVTPEADYRIAGSTTAPVKIRFALLPTPPADLPSLASGLIAHGCKGQIDMLIAATTNP